MMPGVPFPPVQQNPIIDRRFDQILARLDSIDIETGRVQKIWAEKDRGLEVEIRGLTKAGTEGIHGIEEALTGTSGEIEALRKEIQELRTAFANEFIVRKAEIVKSIEEWGTATENLACAVQEYRQQILTDNQQLSRQIALDRVEVRRLSAHHTELHRTATEALDRRIETVVNGLREDLLLANFNLQAAVLDSTRLNRETRLSLWSDFWSGGRDWFYNAAKRVWNKVIGRRRG